MYFLHVMRVIFGTLCYFSYGFSKEFVVDFPDSHDYLWGNNANDSIFHNIARRQTGSQRLTENGEYDTCTTPLGEPGHCRLITYCRLPELKNDVWRVVDHLCIIEQSSIGICCPDRLRSQLAPEIVTNINSNDEPEERIVNTSANRGCGLTTRKFTKITGGRPAESDEWPWMAVILRDGYPFPHCGGVLITNRHILTAAHCIHQLLRNEIFVRLGEYNFREQNETRSRDLRVSSMVQHIDFDPYTYENDIALLRVERPTLFNTYIWPICLPPIGENWEGWNGIVTGWGTTFFGGPHSDVLMEVVMPVWNQEDCRANFIDRIPDTVLCAGASEGGRDSCQGDSGGPLVVQLPNRRWVAIGIVSWGIRCGEKNRPGLYTRVDKFLTWIIQNSDI